MLPPFSLDKFNEPFLSFDSRGLETSQWASIDHANVSHVSLSSSPRLDRSAGIA
jgi:hypothetical protein